MKAYIKREKPCFDYPDEMAKILIYLNEHGHLMVPGSTVEWLYREFSSSSSAGWLCVYDEILEDFANWLAEYNL